MNRSYIVKSCLSSAGNFRLTPLLLTTGHTISFQHIFLPRRESEMTFIVTTFTQSVIPIHSFRTEAIFFVNMERRISLVWLSIFFRYGPYFIMPPFSSSVLDNSLPYDSGLSCRAPESFWTGVGGGVDFGEIRVLLFSPFRNGWRKRG